jgi:hypothetical protein
LKAHVADCHPDVSFCFSSGEIAPVGFQMHFQQHLEALVNPFGVMPDSDGFTELYVGGVGSTPVVEKGYRQLLAL